MLKIILIKIIKNNRIKKIVLPLSVLKLIKIQKMIIFDNKKPNLY